MASAQKRNHNDAELSDNSYTSTSDYSASEISIKSNKKRRNYESLPKKSNYTPLRNNYLSERTVLNSRSNNANKNALMARENRMRKKLYIENLESDIQRFKRENTDLKSRLGAKDSVINDLKLEVKYLRSLLSNTKEIGVLLKNIQSSSGLPVTTSLKGGDLLNSIWNEPVSPMLHSSVGLMSDVDFSIGDMFPTSTFDDLLENPQLVSPLSVSDHRYSVDDQSSEDEVGVCLHVSGKKVALEFCSKCNSNAQDAWKREKKLI